MKKNDLIELEITAITNEGNGLGRYNSLVVFVPNTAIGDKILARVLKVKKSYAYAKIETILQPSNQRIESDCELSKKCGGCCFRHITYKAELKLKEQIVYDALTHIAKMDENCKDKMSPIIGAENIDAYRNKVQVPVQLKGDNVVTGFFSLHTHRVTECTNCRLQLNVFNDIIDEVKRWMMKYNISAYDENTKTGLIRHIYLRRAEVTNQIMVCLVCNSFKLNQTENLVNALTEKFSNIKSIFLNLNDKATNVILGKQYKLLWGQRYINDILCDLRFNISPQSFYQVNHNQTEKLYRKVREFAELTQSDNVLDLFCGIGTIGLTLAKYCNKLLGVEIVEDAIKNAKSNAHINNISNAEFICTDANKITKLIQDKKFNPSVIVIDPPRKGCSAGLVEEIARLSPKRVVYVSCNPATLARDLKEFSLNGFICEKVAPVDMFPRTSHVETVVLMSRKEK